MANRHGDLRSSAKPLRLWPGILIVLVQWVARFGIPVVLPDFTAYGVMIGIAGGLALLVWWLFFSRAAWVDRLGGIVLMIGAMAATWPLLDGSIATGAMGGMFLILAIPGLCLAFVVAAAATRHMRAPVRRATMAAAIVLACGVWTLVRTGGFTGSFDNDLAWRWRPTAEQRLLARGESFEAAQSSPADVAGSGSAPVTAPPPAAPASSPDDTAKVADVESAPSERPSMRVESPAVGEPSITGAEWPGFRGLNRNGIVRGSRINTDWSASPPVQIWRRAIGPGWSSFAVQGDLLYTQEQRGDDEIVAAYRVSTGAPVWQHRDGARFWESNGGPGPRGTPTLANGRVYAFGATGILNALDAASGRIVWSRNVSADTGISLPDWGFASSPLLLDDLVVVAAAGTLAAYEVITGAPRWVGADGGSGYSSPHPLTINGVQQILLLDQHGATSVAPADGKRLWDFKTGSSSMAAPIVQPAITEDGDLLLGDGTASAVYRVGVSQGPDGWTVAERWRTTALKPYFNDFVVHKGHAYGYDGSILACIDLADGTRKWKGGRYGNGQLVLLADQDLLLVVSEEGEFALVRAAADKFTEVARSAAIESKTWNHPVVIGDVLIVRNGEEMAAFRLAAASR